MNGKQEMKQEVGELGSKSNMLKDEKAQVQSNWCPFLSRGPEHSSSENSVIS